MTEDKPNRAESCPCMMSEEQAAVITQLLIDPIVHGFLSHAEQLSLCSLGAVNILSIVCRAILKEDELIELLSTDLRARTTENILKGMN